MRQLPNRHGGQVRALDLVAPLAIVATDTRNADTRDDLSHRDPPRAVSPLINASLTKGFRRGRRAVREPPRYANDSSYAWYQSFNNGNQNNYHMDNKLRGCAVRKST